jgi:hypothetical protein
MYIMIKLSRSFIIKCCTSKFKFQVFLNYNCLNQNQLEILKRDFSNVPKILYVVTRYFFMVLWDYDINIMDISPNKVSDIKNKTNYFFKN